MFDLKAFRNKVSLSQKELANLLGCGQPNISAMEKIKKDLEPAYKEILINKYGEELYSQFEIVNTPEQNGSVLGHPVRQPSELLKQVRMFTVTPTATFTELTSCFNDDYSTIGIVPETGEYLDKSYAVFEIRGESMEPTVRDHAKILCKEMPESRWYDAEGVVVISYKDRVVLKRILRNSFYTDNTILLGSDNPSKQFSATETVQWSDIHAIFKAKRILSQDIV